MDDGYWWLLVLGTVFSVGVTALFLYSLFLGLRKRVWWPLLIVLTLWLTGMVAYSGWDGERRREEARRRAEPLGLRLAPAELVPCAVPADHPCPPQPHESAPWPT